MSINEAILAHDVPAAETAEGMIDTSLNENLGSHLKVSEIAAALKEYAKTIPGSKYVVDRGVYAAVGLTVTGAGSR